MGFEGDETFTIEQLRAKFKWFKKQWQIIDYKIKNGTGLGGNNTAVLSWYDTMNPHFCEAADDMTSVSSKASDIDTTFDSSGSENHSNPESSDESNYLSDTRTSKKKMNKSAGRNRPLNTSFERQSAGESGECEIITEAIEVEQEGTNTDKSKKKKPYQQDKKLECILKNYFQSQDR